jgi:hypothetical protein
MKALVSVFSLVMTLFFLALSIIYLNTIIFDFAIGGFIACFIITLFLFFIDTNEEYR